MPEVHALLSASGAHRWMECTPSAILEQNFENKSSVFAEEGTLAHHVAELKLRKFNGEITTKEYNKRFKEIAHRVDAEMDNATNVYVDVVAERLAEMKSKSPDAMLIVEQRLDFSNVVPHGFGTGDAVIVSDYSIEVIDLKYGKGIPVSAIGNPQTRLYALGAWNMLGSIYDPTMMHSTIVQPRLDSISTEELTVEELLEWAEKEVRPRAKLAIDGKGVFKSGEHCRFCRAAATCRARADEALQVLQHEFNTPPTITDEEVEKILPLLDKLVSWAKDIQEYAFNLAMTGKKWSGYKLVEGRSNRKFSDEAVVAGKLKDAGIADDVIYTKSLATITALEKALGKKPFAEILSDCIIKPPGEPTLVEETDRREEISIAELDFK